MEEAKEEMAAEVMVEKVVVMSNMLMPGEDLKSVMTPETEEDMEEEEVTEVTEVVVEMEATEEEIKEEKDMETMVEVVEDMEAEKMELRAFLWTKSMLSFRRRSPLPNTTEKLRRMAAEGVEGVMTIMSIGMMTTEEVMVEEAEEDLKSFIRILNSSMSLWMPLKTKTS